MTDKTDKLQGSFSIGTIGSHSALNILSGARKEGFQTTLITTPRRQEFYSSFEIADRTVLVDRFDEIVKRQEDLDDVILVPHGSFVAYVDLKLLKTAGLKIYGDVEVLEWEADRQRKNLLLGKTGTKIPKEFKDISSVDRPVIVKTDGAGGGRGYFFASNRAELEEKLESVNNPIFIQEYIFGTKIFVHYFHSAVRNRLEISSADIRYETDIDSKIRHPGNDSPAFQVVGNIPIALRESTLFEYYEIGKAFVEATRKLLPRPISGPFCLETIIDRDLNIYCFEFSGRIVAGTTPFIPYSPYSYVMFGKKMWTGRRIALEIREALENDQLDQLLA
ncbi:MAG: formate--phosphoribosylaminoimidazolecarboxamide ligase [Candidatus Odinarchaeota archaeon]